MQPARKTDGSRLPRLVIHARHPDLGRITIRFRAPLAEVLAVIGGEASNVRVIEKPEPRPCCVRLVEVPDDAERFEQPDLDCALAFARRYNDLEAAEPSGRLAVVIA